VRGVRRQRQEEGPSTSAPSTNSVPRAAPEPVRLGEGDAGVVEEDVEPPLPPREFPGGGVGGIQVRKVETEEGLSALEVWHRCLDVAYRLLSLLSLERAMV